VTDDEHQTYRGDAVNWVMCRACGEFTQAMREDGELVPLFDECAACGGSTFVDHTSRSGPGATDRE
jgi:translation initiation factor 2 beta subunit (eIF-2beta)/eIF-5